MKQKKKILALALTCAMLVSCASTGFATDAALTGTAAQTQQGTANNGSSSGGGSSIGSDNNFGIIEGTPSEKPSKTADLDSLVDLSGIKYGEAGVKGPNTSLPSRDDTKMNVYIDITKDGYNENDEVTFDVVYAGLPSGKSIEGMEFKVDVSALKDVEVSSEVLASGTDLNISGTTIIVAYNGVSNPLTDASKVVFSVKGKLSKTLADYENITASGIFMTTPDGTEYDQELGTAVAYADSFGTTIPVPAETANVKSYKVVVTDKNGTVLTEGTDYELITPSDGGVLTSDNIKKFMEETQIKFYTEGKVKQIEVIYNENDTKTAIGNGALVTPEQGSKEELVPVEKKITDVISIDKIASVEEAGVKGPNTSLPSRDDTKMNVYIDITKDGYNENDEVTFDVVYAGLPSGKSIEGMEFKVDVSALKDVEVSSEVLASGTDLNISGTTIIVAYNGVSNPLTDASKVVFSVKGKLSKTLADYENITASGIFMTTPDGTEYDQELGTAVAYADSFGTTIPVPAQTKNIDNLTFNFVGADNSKLGYGSDYAFKVNNRELSFDDAKAELAKIKTNADLNTFLNNAKIVFKAEGKFDVAVTYAGEAAVTEGMTETVKPKPATDPGLENLKTSYTVPTVEYAKTKTVKLAVLFGSDATSSKDMYTALKGLQDATEVKVTKVITGSGMSSVNIDDVTASASKVGTLLKDVTTVKELIDAINSVDFKINSSSASEFKFEATIGGKAVTLLTKYKNPSNSGSGTNNGITGDDDKDKPIVVPNFGSGGILTKANSSTLNGKTVTPLLATSDKFMINVSGVTNMTGFDPLLVKVPYTLGAKNAADIVVLDKSNNVVGRSAYLDNGYVGVAVKNVGSGNGYTIATRRQNFNDTNIDWANDAISALAVRGIVKGVENGNFEPERSITRAEFIKLVVAMFDVADNSAKAQFTDVADTDWYSSVIGTAQNLGITTGYEDGSFDPNATITRQEMCTMLSRAASVLGVTLKNVNAMTTYDDDAQIGDWAKDSVYTMQMANVMKGVGYNQFQPTSNTTRAQAAVAIYNMLKASLEF